MQIIISLVVAYLLIGIGEVIGTIGSRPLDRPGWALRPTIGKAILVGLTWPWYQFMNNAYPYSSRPVAFALFSIIWQMGVLAGFVWCCISVSVYIFDSTALQIITTIILIAVGALFILPWLTLLMTPLMFLIGWPLDLLFPHEKEIGVRETESGDDHKVEHTGFSRLSAIEDELKSKK